MGRRRRSARVSKMKLALAALLLLLCIAPLQGCTAVGGIGSGGCPRSCFSTCQAANFASTTTCTYTHVTTGIFLSGSQTITKTCTECYGAASAASTAITSLTTAITNLFTSLTALLG